MNVHLGTILEEELDILNAAVNLCEPTEVDGQGVLVTCVNGVRTWRVTSKTLESQFAVTNISLMETLSFLAVSLMEQHHSATWSIRVRFQLKTTLRSHLHHLVLQCV